MAIIETTTVIGTILDSITQNVTGSLFLTLLFITMLFIAIAGAFSLPLELTAPFILPFLLVSAVVTSEIIPVLGATLIYLAIVFTKRLFLN